jgi:hypothetical protein
VWEIPSAPLTVPPHLGIDHFAAFPPGLVRPVVLGWSPPGVCTACGEGRRPVVDKATIVRAAGDAYAVGRQDRRVKAQQGRSTRPNLLSEHTITGHVCACNPGRPFCICGWPELKLGSGGLCKHCARPIAPLTRPAVVLDPFGGTGTTALVATVHGRHGITIDLSADYCRLARWRVSDPGERARALQVPKPPPVPSGQQSFDDLEAEEAS